MLRSMTGFGVGRANDGEEELTVELRSVNHKFCEVKPRLPRELSVLESTLVKSVKDKLARGAIDAHVKRQGKSSTGNLPTVDLELARGYLDALQKLSRELRVQDSVTN